MAPILLSNLGDDAKDVTLRLRLLNCWKAGNPTTPDSFFAYSTLWMDQTGARIEGTAAPVHADSLASQLQLRRVYDVAGFSLTYPRRSHRATSYPRYIQLTPTTAFVEVSDPGDTFVQDSFDFVPFDQLVSRLAPFAYLSDVVGRLVSISEPDHLSTVKGFAKKQAIVLSNDSGDHLSVTLWGSFCTLLVPDDLMVASLSGPVIIAFGGMLVTSFRGQVSVASSSATRISVAPPVDHALALAVNDSSVTRFDVLQARFPDPASLEEHENRYRCKAVVQSIDGEDRWCYLACKLCTRVVTPVDGKFWCDRHELLDGGDTTHCYKIHLRVSDATAEATFILLGYSADAIMPINAAELRRAFPYDGPDFPPQIEMFRNLELTFELQQPGRPRPGAFADFRVSKILDLPTSFGPRHPRSSIRSLSSVAESSRDSSSRVLDNPSADPVHNSSPSLGVGRLALSSPPANEPAEAYFMRERTGCLALPSPPNSSNVVLATPEKNPSLPSASEPTPTTPSSAKRQTPDSAVSKLDSLSGSDVEPALDSDDESIAQMQARIKRTRSKTKSSARRSLFTSEYISEILTTT
ncbi:Replication protein A 70 kDa DNA-binding subunit B [Linum perenne]